jgi:hypothetical protein
VETLCCGDTAGWVNMPTQVLLLLLLMMMMIL